MNGLSNEPRQVQNRTRLILGIALAVASGVLLVLPLLIAFGPIAAGLVGLSTVGFSAGPRGLQAIAGSGMIGGAGLVGGIWVAVNSRRQ